MKTAPLRPPSYVSWPWCPRTTGCYMTSDPTRPLSCLWCNAIKMRGVRTRVKLGPPAAVILAVVFSACTSVGAGSTVPSSSPSVPGTVTSTPDPTIDWVAYRSSAGQFSLRHPPDWFISPEGNNNGFVSVGRGTQHPLGPLDYVTDIGAGSWPVAQQMDTTCFKLSAISQSDPETVDRVNGCERPAL